MTKQNPNKKKAPVRQDTSIVARFRRYSFSEKVMFVLSIMIVVAMILGLFASFVPQAIN